MHPHPLTDIFLSVSLNHGPKEVHDFFVISVLILYHVVIRASFTPEGHEHEVRESWLSNMCHTAKSITLMSGKDQSEIDLSKKSTKMSPATVLLAIGRVCGRSGLSDF